MYNRIQEAFDTIRADEDTKEKTKAYVLQMHPKGTAPKKTSHARWLTAACAALLVLGSGSIWFFTPVAAISAEGRNTVELGVNAFDRVISVKAVGETPKVQFMNYQKALECVLTEDDETSMAVTVIGDSEERKVEMLEEISSCMHGLKKEIHCAATTTEKAAAAHECGITPGKYESYLAMLEMDETVTVEEVQNMTMSEIRTWLTHHEQGLEEEHGTISDGTVEEVEIIEESTQTGFHHGHGAENGNGHHNAD